MYVSLRFVYHTFCFYCTSDSFCNCLGSQKVAHKIGLILQTLIMWQTGFSPFLVANKLARECYQPAIRSMLKVKTGVDNLWNLIEIWKVANFTSAWNCPIEAVIETTAGHEHAVIPPVTNMRSFRWSRTCGHSAGHERCMMTPCASRLKICFLPPLHVNPLPI